MLACAAVKEFYIDKHFEDSQSFAMSLEDFAGYVIGTGLALAAFLTAFVERCSV